MNFESLETEFSFLLNLITRKSQHLGNPPDPSKKAELERDLKSAFVLLSKLETAAKKSEQQRERLQLKCRNYAADLARLEKTVSGGSSSVSSSSSSSSSFSSRTNNSSSSSSSSLNWAAAQEDLMRVSPTFNQPTKNTSSSVPPPSFSSSRQQQVFLEADEGTDRLRNALAVSSQSEETGASTLQELNRQREQLESAGSRLHQVDANMARSRSILRSMATRVATSKIVLIIIIIALLAGIGVVVWWRWFR